MTTTIVSDLKRRLTELLVARSVRRGTFKLASGRQSSYYIDARLTTMSAEGLVVIGELGLATIRLAAWQARSVGGLTLGADPVAYAIAAASRLSPPAVDAFTVRKEAKAHGTGKQIEGCFEPGISTVVVEDVLTTGGSAARAAEAVRQAGGSVAGILAVVDREEGGANALAAAGYAVISLVTVRDLGV